MALEHCLGLVNHVLILCTITPAEGWPHHLLRASGQLLLVEFVVLHVVFLILVRVSHSPETARTLDVGGRGSFVVHLLEVVDVNVVLFVLHGFWLLCWVHASRQISFDGAQQLVSSVRIRYTVCMPDKCR